MALTEKYVSSLASGGGDGSIGNPWTWAEMISDINAGGKAGTRYNVKADGTYSRTTTNDVISSGGDAINPVVIRGYATTIGDGYLGRSGNNGPLIVTNIPTITYTTGRLNVTGIFIILETLNVTSASSNPTIGVSQDSIVRSCVVTNSSTNANATGLSLGTRVYAIDCDVSLTGSSGGSAALSTSIHGRAFNNRVVVQHVAAPAISVIGGSSQSAIVGNYTISGSYGVYVGTNTAFPVVMNNTSVGCVDAVYYVSGLFLQHVHNSMLTDTLGFGIQGATGRAPVTSSYVRTRDNISGAMTGNGWMEATQYKNVTADLGGPETDYANYNAQNLNLIATSVAVGSGLFSPSSIGALQIATGVSSPAASGPRSFCFVS